MPAKMLFLFPPRDDENTSLALRPLHIAGMYQPIAEGDGGISISVATENPAGMLSAINPYLNMKAGDKLEIYWDSAKILERMVEDDEVDRPVFFYLPAPLESGWVQDCHYLLTRAGETVPDEPSVPSRFLVKLFRPGFVNQTPHRPELGHSRLFPVQLPPELVEQGVIDAEWAKKGVPVTVPFYRDMAIRDSIRLYWGSFALPPHRVTHEQAQGQQPIVIMADQDVILAGGDGDSLKVIYKVHDEVWNWADLHSQLNHIGVDAGGWRLEPPIIEQSINGVITIRDLNKQPVTVQINVRTKDYDLGDTITMTWIGTPPFDGEPLTHTEDRIIDNIPGILRVDVPYEKVRGIAMGRADASYVLRKKNGGPPLSSRHTFAEVVGDVDMLPEPTVRELIGDVLESDTPYATVDVHYDKMASGDLVNLIWLGTRADSRPYLHEQPHTVTRNEAEAGLITLYVDNEHISVLDNGRLDLSYRVSNDKTTQYAIRESERLLVKVQSISATLPAPKVEEADPPGNVLDPAKVFDFVHVLIDQAKTIKGDVVTYYWRSSNPFASTSDWVPITSVTQGMPVRFRVDAEFVTDNIGQYVKVHYSVLRTANNQYEYSATLNLLIGEVVVPTISSVTDLKGDEIPNGGITVETSVTLSGIASKGLKVEVFDGPTSKGPATANATTGGWELTVTGLSITAHSFKAKALYGSGLESEPRSLTVVALLRPTIANVTDSKGTVQQNGITFDRSVTISGKASPNQKVRLLDHTATLYEPTANASGDWSHVVNSLTVKPYSLTALALYGDGPVSTPPRIFTVRVGLVRDFTDFTNQNWNGWVGGPGVDPRDLALRNVNGNWRFHNYTHTDQSNGVIIQKALTNVQSGGQYRFTIKAIRFNDRFTVPSLSIRAAGTTVAGPTQIDSQTNWITLSGSFTATATTISVDVYSNVATGSGNDYEIDDIEILAI